jgi:hypothetical protein
MLCAVLTAQSEYTANKQQEHDMTNHTGTTPDEILSSDNQLLVEPGQHPTGWEAVACPEDECGAMAEVIDRYTLRSTDGPVVMVRTRCLRRHIRDWIDES